MFLLLIKQKLDNFSRQSISLSLKILVVMSVSRLDDIQKENTELNVA